MSDVILDASALLTIFLAEPGADQALRALPTAVISAVNLVEVAAKLQERGMPDDRVRAAIEALELNIVALDSSLAIEAGLLRAHTRSAGLSLGDRACLALARSRGGVALTADRAWEKLDIGVSVELVR